jgi:hypothetical protein
MPVLGRPGSPYFKPVFGSGNKRVLLRRRLRSALATQQVQRMGLEPVAHIAGGFGAGSRLADRSSP